VIVEYLDLADYVGIAAEVTGLDEAIVLKIANLDLADSALHAPSAEFGGEEFYPDLVTKAALLLVRLPKANRCRREQPLAEVRGCHQRSAEPAQILSQIGRRTELVRSGQFEDAIVPSGELGKGS
jgi:hypothetical protein